MIALKPPKDKLALKWYRPAQRRLGVRPTCMHACAERAHVLAAAFVAARAAAQA